jgi:hypothetical protein
VRSRASFSDPGSSNPPAAQADDLQQLDGTEAKRCGGSSRPRCRNIMISASAAEPAARDGIPDDYIPAKTVDDDDVRARESLTRNHTGVVSP